MGNSHSLLVYYIVENHDKLEMEQKNQTIEIVGLEHLYEMKNIINLRKIISNREGFYLLSKIPFIKNLRCKEKKKVYKFIENGYNLKRKLKNFGSVVKFNSFNVFTPRFKYKVFVYNPIYNVKIFDSETSLIFKFFSDTEYNVIIF